MFLKEIFEKSLILKIVSSRQQKYEKLEKVPWDAYIPPTDALIVPIQSSHCPKNLKMS